MQKTKLIGVQIKMENNDELEKIRTQEYREAKEQEKDYTIADALEKTKSQQTDYFDLVKRLGNARWMYEIGKTGAYKALAVNKLRMIYTKRKSELEKIIEKRQIQTKEYKEQTKEEYEECVATEKKVLEIIQNNLIDKGLETKTTQQSLSNSAQELEKRIEKAQIGISQYHEKFDKGEYDNLALEKAKNLVTEMQKYIKIINDLDLPVIITGDEEVNKKYKTLIKETQRLVNKFETLTKEK